jgi:hypothetical protein
VRGFLLGEEMIEKRTMMEQVRELVCDERIQPDVREDGMPTCSEDACEAYDGKRCRETGFRPNFVCEPAVVRLIHAATEKANLIDQGAPADDLDWIRHILQEMADNAAKHAQRLRELGDRLRTRREAAGK